MDHIAYSPKLRIQYCRKLISFRFNGILQLINSQVIHLIRQTLSIVNFILVQ